ncbi:uncharacterized protein DFL_001487 [Arthrobotrys flagrans]|uniref:DUF7029 domain-containing protein n=1 Tax=Arthrobotrys flagrans TaxID=97331 RepID=A0A437A7R8_ARTFL|nr:hypothetical protein DFL_001487 [Arthrobotrys flagrans]
MRLTTSLAATAVLGALSASAAPTGCAADNVLRHLRASSNLSSALAWCSTYTATPATISQPYPTWLNTQYISSTSRLSSACSCINTAPAVTTSVPSITFGSYIPPHPTSTEDINTDIKNPLPTVVGGPIPLQTAAVEDSIPPVAEKDVFFGGLAEDNTTAFLAQVTYKALDGSNIVNLDDLLNGINGFPVCGENTIKLDFTKAGYRDLVASSWGQGVLLVTAGGNYCGDEGEHNFWKVSSVTGSSATEVTLAVTKVELKDAISALDAEFGTFNINDPNEENSTFRRKLKARGVLDGLINTVKGYANDIKNAFDSLGHPTKRFTTPRYDYDLIGSNLFQINEDRFGASITCNYCGITGGVQLFGSVSADIKNWQTVGLVVGFDLVDPTFNLDMGVGWNFEWTGSQETALVSVVPWAVEIPKILTIEPVAKIIAAVDLDIKSAFQIRHIGFSGKWKTFSVGYNLLTKLPVLTGDVVPEISYLEPNFVNGVSPWGVQDAKVTAWVGPRIGMTVDVLNGLANGNADVTVQFPAVNAEVRLDALSKCPGASGLDMCVGLHADALIRGTASASAGLVGVGEAGVEYEIFRYDIGTFLEDNFRIDV